MVSWVADGQSGPCCNAETKKLWASFETVPLCRPIDCKSPFRHVPSPTSGGKNQGPVHMGIPRPKTVLFFATQVIKQ